MAMSVGALPKSTYKDQESTNQVAESKKMWKWTRAPDRSTIFYIPGRVEGPFMDPRGRGPSIWGRAGCWESHPRHVAADASAELPSCIAVFRQDKAQICLPGPSKPKTPLL